ncbi:MAG: endospore germination permease [Firmicutes bacterium]|nr:endospore germination permease [Bacillota bacterium]
MLEKGKISPRQSGELLFITVFATSILIVPAVTTSIAAQDAWLAILLSTLPGFFLLGVLSWLGGKHPGQTLFQYAETILGKWPGKLFGLLYVWIMLQTAATTTRQFSDYLSTAFMPLTPLSVFTLSLIFLSVVAVISGLEVIARMNEFIILLVVAFLMLVMVLALPNWEPANLLPVLAHGLVPVLRASATPAVFMGEVLVAAVLLPYTTRPQRTFAAGAAALLSAAFLLAAGVVAAIAIFGPALVSVFRFPLHMFVRTINIGDILTRFEVIVMVTWVAGVFIKLSVFLYCASLGLAQVLGLRQYRPVVFPLGILVAVFCFLFFENIVEITEGIKSVAPKVYAIYYLVLPLLLVIITVVREKIFGHKFQAKRQ